MASVSSDVLLPNKWDAAHAAKLSEPERLLYRSNLLGSDLRITNFGGGNTSAKVFQKDPLTGAEVEILWVKGSGGDVGSMKLDGFSTLYMEKLRALKGIYRGPDYEDEMVGYLPHCTFNLNPRAASIDTPLHAYINKPHVDHMHPDAVIAIAASKDSKAITQEVFGSDIGWLPWKRPGYELGLMLEKFFTDNPDTKGVVLESHGLFTWGDSAEECYTTTINIINKAIAWFATKTDGVTVFGGAKHQSLDASQRRAIASTLMPRIRSFIDRDERKIGHFNDDPAVLEFVNSQKLKDLAALGTSCPDHFLRTKIRPIIIDLDPVQPDVDGIIAGLSDAFAAYREDYKGYYDRCKRPNSPAMRDPNPVIYLIPGVGMLSFAKDKATARIAGEFYVNAINVMRGADTVSTYMGLDEQEAFDIEYWLLEEAKLQRMPKPKSLAGQIAVVTGGAGGIGRATCARLLREGACVVACDIDADGLATAVSDLQSAFGKDVVRGLPVNVTDEQSVIKLMHDSCAEFGGIDILVSNAGISSAAPIDETSLAVWQRNMDILSTGYFLVSREAFKIMKLQDRAASMVFVASKNGLVASPGASAYCTAKASEIHLARCLALEGAPYGIRVNVVNPDAVLRGSKIWTGEWREQRAKAYDMEPDQLEEHYRKRSMLKLNVLPEDIAEAIYFLASDMAAKSTGNILNVDAGHAPSFTR